MDIRDLLTDTYKCIIPVNGEKIGPLHLYPIGLLVGKYDYLEHQDLAQMIGLGSDGVVGCYVMRKLDSETRQAILELRPMGCGSVRNATEEQYNIALERGIVIMNYKPKKSKTTPH